MIIQKGWCTIEGNVIPVSDRQYDPPLVYIGHNDIFYDNLEIRMTNPHSLSKGVRYKITYLSDHGFNTINEIDARYADVITMIAGFSEPAEGSTFYTKPFVINESCVIKYCSGDLNVLDQVAIIYVDKYSTAKIASITAQYNGSSVAIGEKFNHEDLVVTAIYTDGETSRVLQGGYTVSSDTISVLGSNVFTVTVPYGNNEFKTNFTVIGIKNLIGIAAKYDGKPIAIGQSPERRSIVVTAKYSDETYSILTDWTFKVNSIVTEENKGILELYHQGFTTAVTIPYYTATPSQLIAFYNGPNVEVGNELIESYVTVKIYYTSPQGENNRYETLTEGFEFSTKEITFEGNNIIEVSYDTEIGKLKTTFSVYGFRPEKKLLYIAADYIGPPVVVGKTFNPVKIICKAFYNDNSSSIIKDFTFLQTTVNKIGANDIVITYKEKNATISIIGISPDSTTESGYVPLSVDLRYPEASMINHRYRGPMESAKFDHYAYYLRDNITELFKIFNDLERQYESMCETITKLNNTGINTLNECTRLTDTINKWSADKRFYKKGE